MKNSRIPLFLICAVIIAVVFVHKLGNKNKKVKIGVKSVHVSTGIYMPPPVGHMNAFVANNINIPVFIFLVEQPLAFYNWFSGDWMPILAQNWKLDKANNYFYVSLRKGVKFHDLTDFTSQDVVDNFYIWYLLNGAVWKYIDRVEALDRYTVRFHINVPNTIIDRYILSTKILPSSVYGRFAEKTKKLIDGKKDRKSKEMAELSAEFNKFRPEKRIGTGPFTMELKNVSESEVVLEKFPQYYEADLIKFDEVRIYNGDVANVAPLIFSKELDYAVHAYTIALERQFEKNGIRVLRTPIYQVHMMMFNFEKYPINIKEVRQAFAHAIDRDEVAYIALGESAKKNSDMTGLADYFTARWISKDIQKKINKYEYNLEKAAKLMEKAGFVKNKNGFWQDKFGKEVEISLTCPLEYAMTMSAAEDIVLQMEKFGVKVVLRGITIAQFSAELMDGRFQSAIISGSAAHPHPHFSYYANFLVFNQKNAGISNKPGMSFPLKQKIDALGGSELNIGDTVMKCAEGYDFEVQRKHVEKLAIAFNEYLPGIPLMERLGNCPVLEGVRIKPLPKKSPYYENTLYTENYFLIMLMKGIIEPVD